MHKQFIWAATAALSLFPFLTYADNTTAQIDAVTKDVQAVCTQPATQAEHWEITGDGSADAGINLRMLKVGSIAAHLHFSKEEWLGVQQVLKNDQARDNASYRQCARELAPKFLEKIKSITVANNCINSNCAAINTGEQVQYYTNAAPPERVITPENEAAAVNVLQTAPHGSTVFLNYSATDGVQEIQRFYDQVVALFGKADHWIVIGTAKIGPSMIFVDGGTLNGAGVGCSARDPSTDATAIGKHAMEVAGFPCMRKAADWGSRHSDEKGNYKPETLDLVVSIGSRFVQPE